MLLTACASGLVVPTTSRADAPLVARLDVPPASTACVDATDLEALAIDRVRAREHRDRGATFGR